MEGSFGCDVYFVKEVVCITLVSGFPSISNIYIFFFFFLHFRRGFLEIFHTFKWCGD